MKPSFKTIPKPRDAAETRSSARAQQEFRRGLAFHQKGQLAQAQASYEQVLALQPEHFDALHMLGAMALQLKHPKLALEFIAKAIELNSQVPAAYYNYGIALQELDQDQAALQSYDRAIALEPDYAVVYDNRGSVLRKLNRRDEALASYREAIRLAPNSEGAYCNRGVVLREMNRLDESLASHEQAIRLKPDYAKAHNNRGVTLQELKRFEDALKSYDQAIKLRPDYAKAYYNRGITLQELKRLEEALESYDQAIELKPDYAEAYSNRGITLQELKRWQDALASHEQAISLRPDYASAHCYHSLCCLSMGDFARGWEGYEWRWESEKTGLKRSRITQEWNGEKLKGSLLVMSEQGVGDEIFYSGMLNDLRSHAESITVCVDSRLVKLYQRSFDHIEVIPRSALNPGMHFDAQVYMASLGRYFRQTSGAFHNVKVPYLRPCAGRVQKLRAQIRGGKRLSCGLSWISKNPGIGAEKSLQLNDLESILKLPDINFVDLQYGDTSQERSELHAATGIALKRMTDIDNFNDIDGLAALMESCDVIVTVSNTTAHLAAALGKPVFIMLPFSTGLLWYWHIDRADSPWYPSARLFRQERRADWGGVIQRISQALQDLALVT